MATDHELESRTDLRRSFQCARREYRFSRVLQIALDPVLQKIIRISEFLKKFKIKFTNNNCCYTYITMKLSLP